MPATQPHTRPAAAPCGYETEADTRPVTRPVYDAARALHGPAVVGAMQPHNLAMLTGAIEAARVQLGAYDRRILTWLAGFEPATCAVIAELIRRAHADVPLLTADETSTVLAGQLRSQP